MNDIDEFDKITNLHTLASVNKIQFGLKKYLNPLSAPSKVRDLPKNTIISRNGNVAVK